MKHLILLLLIVFSFIGLSCCIFAHGFTQSAGVAAESDGSNMLYTLKGQLLDVAPIDEAGLRDFLSLSLGFQDLTDNEFHFGLCLANLSLGRTNTIDRQFHNIELMNYKSNYGLHDVKLGLLAYETGSSVRLFRHSESNQLGQTDLSEYSITESFYADLFYALGFAAEYDQLEKPVERDQKWYIGPTVSLGFSSYLAYLNVYARLRCGVNKSSLVSEAVIPFNWRKEICMRVFFNADYYYSLQSARDNTFLKSFGVGLVFKI